jgi:hypothetical protein
VHAHALCPRGAPAAPRAQRRSTAHGMREGREAAANVLPHWRPLRHESAAQLSSRTRCVWRPSPASMPLHRCAVCTAVCTCSGWPPQHDAMPASRPSAQPPPQHASRWGPRPTTHACAPLGGALRALRMMHGTHDTCVRVCVGMQCRPPIATPPASTHTCNSGSAGPPLRSRPPRHRPARQRWREMHQRQPAGPAVTRRLPRRPAPARPAGPCCCCLRPPAHQRAVCCMSSPCWRCWASARRRRCRRRRPEGGGCADGRAPAAPLPLIRLVCPCWAYSCSSA